MIRVSPFEALRPLPNLAARVASVPYDVVTVDEARRLADGNPYSFLHIVRSEIDLPEGTDPFSDEVYATADRNLRRFIHDGVFTREDGPALYLYRLVMNGHSQVGLVCCCHIDDYTDNVIRKHERTRRDKEDDRTRHILALGAQPGPVLSTFRDHPTYDQLVRKDINTRPLYHFNAPDGVTHTIWPVTAPDGYCEFFEGLDCAYVADGHHRAASAARAGAERRAANPGHTGDEEYNWFLSVLFPAGSLTILPYNRVVIDLGGGSAHDLLRRLSDVGTVAPADRPRPAHAGTFCFYLDGSWRSLELGPDTIARDDPIGSLDVALLQDRVLDPILGITDQRGDPRLEFVGGVRGPGELQRRVDRGSAAIAFSLYPTSIDQLLAVADAGLVMPPKSTWFEPKLRSGLFVHEI